MDTGTGPPANPQNPSPSEAHWTISNLTEEVLAQHIHGAFSAPKYSNEYAFQVGIVDTTKGRFSKERLLSSNRFLKNQTASAVTSICYSYESNGGIKQSMP